MSKIALIEAKPSRTDYYSEFDCAFDLDIYQLCSDPTVRKVYKKDVDLDIDTTQYDWVILVGSECLKYFTKVTKVMDYSGKKVQDNFLASMNPSMLAFKPEMRPLWEETKTSISKYVTGEIKDIDIDEHIEGIEDESRAIEWITDAINYPSKLVAVDSETSGLFPRDGDILGISLCVDQNTGVYINSLCITERVEELLQRLLLEKLPIFHNAKFDIPFFEYHFNVRIPQFHDTMLLHYLGNENPGTHGLKQLAMRYTPFGDYEKEMYSWIEQFCKENGILKGDFRWSWVPFDVMKRYAAMDAVVTYQVFNTVSKVLQNPKMKNVYDTILIPGCRFLMEMQDNGVPFDTNRLLQSHKYLTEEIEEGVAALNSTPEVKAFEKDQGAPFNPGSVVQLRKLLFDYLMLTPTGIKTGTGEHSTNAEALEILAEKHAVPAQILKIRRLSKIKNTYIDKIIPQLDRDGRLRTNFNLHGTTSGRLSSSGKLNMQQLQRDNPIVKGCIKAKEGHTIVAMDLQTAEMYVAAVLSGDKNLQEVFKSDGNFHSTIAKQVFNLPCPIEEVPEKFGFKRQAAKAVSFGILYGAQAAKISDLVTKDSGSYFSLDAAQEVIDDYFGSFPQLKKWLEQNKVEIKARGFAYSFFGRKRRLPNVRSSDRGTVAHTIRSGLNFLVQSPASDINLLAAIDMQAFIKANKLGARIFALVHDSILAEVPDEEVDLYCQALQNFVQKDRGLSIPDSPIKTDFEVGEDYSMGKYEKYFEEMTNNLQAGL